MLYLWFVKPKHVSGPVNSHKFPRCLSTIIRRIYRVMKRILEYLICGQKYTVSEMQLFMFDVFWSFDHSEMGVQFFERCTFTE